MSATVKTSNNLNLSSDLTFFVKSFIILGSLNSYLNAVLLINKWCRTNHSTVSVSSLLSPNLGQITDATNAPFTEWSPFFPLAISCKSIATNKHLNEVISVITLLARGAKFLNFPLFNEWRLEIVKIVCSSTV